MPRGYKLNRKGYNPQWVPEDRPDMIAAVENVPNEAGLDFSEDHRKKLGEIADHFLWDLDSSQSQPIRDEVKNNLTKVMKTCQGFSELLHKIDIESRRRLKLKDGPMTEVTDWVDQLKHAAVAALRGLPKTRTWAKKPSARSRFLFDLAQLFYEATGVEASKAYSHDRGKLKAYSGPFFDLVEGCLHTTGQHVTSNGALGKEIYRALKKMKNK